jgi:TolB protein
LIDWSGDKTRALVGTPSGELDQLVLATGKITTIKLPREAMIIGYTLPTGHGLLAWQGNGHHQIRLSRYNLTGRLAKVLISDGEAVSAVYSDSGAVLAVTALNGVWLVSNNGRVTRKLPVPGVSHGCTPTRWWNTTTVLASCQASKNSRTRLWLVPAGGAKPRPLTRQYGQHGLDPGDLLAWPLDGSVYLQSLSVGGHERIFKQSSGQKITAVPIPHQPNDHAIGTAHGARLLVIAQTFCGEHASLLWFNPVTGREQPLLNTAPGLAGVLGVRPFGPPVADIYIAVGCVAAAAARRTVRF